MIRGGLRAVRAARAVGAVGAVSAVPRAVAPLGRAAPLGASGPSQSRRHFAALEKEPEYASGDLSGYNTFHYSKPLELMNGGALPEMQIAWESWGTLNDQKNNAILLQTGMSASSHAASHRNNTSPGWWEDFIGPGKTLDTNLFYVICTNNLGGCYGSTGPSSKDPSGKRYGSRFPRFQVADQVAAQMLLLDSLGIQKLHAAVGSSLGGMQSVCTAGLYPERVGKFVSISACAKSFPGSMAFRHAQRKAIMADPNWKNGDYYDGPLPEAGLMLARQLGTITYRSGSEWQQRFGQNRKTDCGTGEFKETGLDHEWEIEHYLAHQGKKWVNNYDPNSMLWISKAMDGFSMEAPDADGRPSLIEGLKKAMMPALVIGVQHDVLFPVWQQKQIADSLRAAGNKSVVYYELDTIFGHDSFLLDAVSIGPAVKGHLEQEPNGALHLWADMAESTARVLQAVTSRGCTADAMRSVFRALAQQGDNVDKTRLRAVTKLTWKDIDPATVDKLFDDRMPGKTVNMQEFLTLLPELMAGQGNEAFLP
mmetsp:Transcript_67152/g.176071  ORF Transcript_67152/g.176071 Transcript_67152/m.176071 type:complete len:536 (-) Transcript_67152:92-1699(-)